MTEEEKKKRADQFREIKKKDQPEKTDDSWTEEEIRAAANRIAERMGLNVRW